MFAGVVRERDPNLINMEKNIFSQLTQIGMEEDKLVGFIEQKPKPLLAVALSPEEAIKELLNMQKKIL